VLFAGERTAYIADATSVLAPLTEPFAIAQCLGDVVDIDIRGIAGAL